jgi:hypothetical protein
MDYDLQEMAGLFFKQHAGRNSRFSAAGGSTPPLAAEAASLIKQEFF